MTYFLCIFQCFMHCNSQFLDISVISKLLYINLVNYFILFSFNHPTPLNLFIHKIGDSSKRSGGKQQHSANQHFVPFKIRQRPDKFGIFSTPFVSFPNTSVNTLKFYQGLNSCSRCYLFET